jgi:hypothetical protein
VTELVEEVVVTREDAKRLEARDAAEGPGPLAAVG